jgi:HEAT repeats
VKTLRLFAIGVVVLLGTTWKAQAWWHGGVSIGIGPVWVGGPYYGYGYYPYPYAYPYPYYYAAPPVVVQPAPAYPGAPATAAAPGVQPAPTATPVTARSPAQDGNQVEIEKCLQQLSDTDEHVRADAAVQLGRLRAGVAIDPLVAMLAGDRSPAVREACARGLGLIGSARSLAALQRSAQSDPDRDVRHSAQFACEVVASYRNP